MTTSSRPRINVARPMIPGGDPAHSPAKYIYTNKDVAVSAFHHTKHFSSSNVCFTDFDAYFESFINGDVHYGLWFDHVLEWWKHRGM